MKKLLLLLMLSSSITFAQKADDDLLYNNYARAIENVISTFPYFLVINVFDRESGTINEVALDGNTLHFLVIEEYDLDALDTEEIVDFCKRNKSRTYTFTSAKAKERLNRVQYSQKELDAYAAKIKLPHLITQIQQTKGWSYYPESEKEQYMLAHLLFNESILTGTNNCLGGGDVIHIDWKE